MGKVIGVGDTSIWEHFIIENSHIVGIENYSLYLLITYIGVVVIATLVWFFTDCDRHELKSIVIGNVLKTVIFLIISCGMILLIMGALILGLMCNTYDKKYQTSAIVISEYSDTTNIKSISIDKSENKHSRNKTEKYYNCVVINKDNSIEIVEIPYEKTRLLIDETSYIEKHYDTLKYPDNSTNDVVKSIDIHITENMLESMLK